jgi:dihydropteroate synthase
MFTLNCKGILISTETPLVMGIINATPDSFYRGDLNSGSDGIIALAKKMTGEGADILDIGGLSTKPGNKEIPVTEEIERLIPVIKKIINEIPDAIISADTYRAEVAKAAVEAGASIINDISGGEADKNMLVAVAEMQVPYICMHMKGMPENMQQHAVYDDVTKEVLDFFIAKLFACKQAGIKDIIFDPGFGFAKTPAQNFKLLKELSVLKILDAPILAGLSRKSTIYKTLGITPDEALNGTTVLNTLALNNGASILRVHDVKEVRETITLFQKYRV